MTKKRKSIPEKLDAQYEQAVEQQAEIDLEKLLQEWHDKFDNIHPKLGGIFNRRAKEFNKKFEFDFGELLADLKIDDIKIDFEPLNR